MEEETSEASSSYPLCLGGPVTTVPRLEPAAAHSVDCECLLPERCTTLPETIGRVERVHTTTMTIAFHGAN